MPELPEVENIRRYLVREGLPGRRIAGARVDWPRLVRAPDLEGFVTGVMGRRIDRVDRRGKYLTLPLDRGVLGMHMGMTGSLKVARPDEPPDRFVHATIDLDDGRRIDLNDPRKWSSLWYVGDADEIVGGLGLDALDPRLTAVEFIRLVRRHSAAIKPVLMDQSVLAGIGNIYADEALFRAGIHPGRATNRIARPRLASLHRAIVDALAHAVGYIGEHPISDGRPFVVDAYDGRMRLPRRPGGRCPNCGGPVRSTRFGNRTAFYCPRCQR